MAIMNLQRLDKWLTWQLLISVTIFLITPFTPSINLSIFIRILGGFLFILGIAMVAMAYQLTLIR